MISHETLIIGGRDSKGNVLSLAAVESALAEMATIYGHAERRYFKESVLDQTPLCELKKSISKRFGLSVRQFTGIRIGIDGLVAGRLETMKLESESLAGRIESVEKKIRVWQKKIAASLKKDDQELAWVRK